MRNDKRLSAIGAGVDFQCPASGFWYFKLAIPVEEEGITYLARRKDNYELSFVAGTEEALYFWFRVRDKEPPLAEATGDDLALLN